MLQHETPSAPRWHVVYLDNNAWVGLSVEKDGVLRHRLTEILTADEDRCLGFGQQNLAEFSDWTNAHEVFAELVSIWPTAILKPSEAITAMEAAAYPAEREHAILAAASPWGPMENVQAHPMVGDGDQATATSTVPR